MVNSIEPVSTGSAEDVHNDMDPAGAPLSARLHKSKHSVKHKGGRRRRKRRRRRRTRKKRGGYGKNNFEDLVGNDIWIAYQEFQEPIFSENMLTQEKVYIANDNDNFYIRVKIIDANPDHLRVGLLYDPPIIDDESASRLYEGNILYTDIIAYSTDGIIQAGGRRRRRRKRRRKTKRRRRRRKTRRKRRTRRRRF